MTTKSRKGKKPSEALTKPAMEAKALTPGDKEYARAQAMTGLRPTINAAAIVEAFSSNTIGKIDPQCAADELRRLHNDLAAGSMVRIEAMLFSQAHSLDVMFASLARRGRIQEGLHQYEVHMKLALRAQSQCRATLETLAAIKNPPVVFAKQANIAHGHQQVNNGTPAAVAPAGETEKPPTELLEHDHGEWLDTRAQGTAGRSNPAMAAVEPIHRPAHKGRQGNVKP